jgi:signal transduction histidine kinase
MENNNKSRDELKATCEDLQGQVIRFLKVEQDLINTRSQLDRDLARFKAIQSYSQKAIQAKNLEEFGEITIESVIETFEVECSAFFSYDKAENCLKVKNMFGFEANHMDCQLDGAWIASRGISQGGSVIIENVSPDSEPMGPIGLSQVIISPYYDDNKNLQGILVGGVSVSKKDYYDEIREELIPSFMVFTQQMSSLLQNFEAKRYLDEKVQQRTAEVVKQKKEIEEKNEELSQQKEKLQTTNEILEDQKEELQRTLENLKLTQSQLVQSEKMASLGGLVAGVAHEINTPVGIGVTAVSSLIEETKRMAELYKKEEITRADFKEYLTSSNNSAKLVMKNLERTAELVQSFKQVSVDQSTEQQREFYLKAYLEDVIRSLYPKFKRRDIDINIDCDEELKLNSYPGVFAQIFTNLVLNSIAHGFKKEKRKGVIDILVKQEDKQIQIEYKDNGEGIPGEIQKLKGSIKCDSEEKKGVVFRIVVPVEGEKV